VYDEGVVKHIEDLAFVLDVVDLLGLEDLHLLEDLGSEELAGLLLFHQPHAAEGASLGRVVPTPMVVRMS
jgi:hypothetical protein